MKSEHRQENKERWNVSSYFDDDTACLLQNPRKETLKNKNRVRDGREKESSEGEKERQRRNKQIWMPSFNMSK